MSPVPHGRPPIGRLLATLLLVFELAACAESPGEFAGIVSAASPEAAAAGREILEAGGNAVDAAVAVAFALAVTEPAGSGLGGQAILLVHPARGEPFVVNGTTLAPRSMPEGVTDEALEGHRLTTVPSLVKVLDHAWRRHGSGKLAWPALLGPAIRTAEDGYPLGFFRYRSRVRYADALRADPVVARLFLDPDGSVPREGAPFKQPVLARTLRRLASAGGEDFYRGEIARQIAADMQKNGGWLTLEDLETFPAPREMPALKGRYRNWDVYSLPPPAGGWVVLQMLRLLEAAPPEGLRPDSAQRMGWLADTLALGHLSRDRAPIRDLANYEAGVARELGAARIQALRRRIHRPGSGETTHFSVVDSSGVAVSATLSINAYFGARVAGPELGFLYNSYMTEFVLDHPGHPFALKPRAMPYSSMAATILARNGEVGLVLGSPGSRRIISAVVQVVSRWVDGGQPVKDAVAVARR